MTAPLRPATHHEETGASVAVPRFHGDAARLHCPNRFGDDRIGRNAIGEGDRFELRDMSGAMLIVALFEPIGELHRRDPSTRFGTGAGEADDVLHHSSVRPMQRRNTRVIRDRKLIPNESELRLESATALQPALKNRRTKPRVVDGEIYSRSDGS